MEGSEAIARWICQSQSTAVVRVVAGQLIAPNATFQKLDGAGEPWRWVAGPHAKVRYGSLAELIRAEAATLAPVPYLSRFERSRQVIEVRLERLGPGEEMALIFDVTEHLRRQRELQRDRETLQHEQRMHAMGVLASGVAHDLNHVLNVMALRVETLRADPALGGSRRTLDGLGRVVGEAARIVARLQDLARKRRDRPTDPLDLAAVLTGAIEMARTEADAARVRIEADVPPLPLVRGSAAELAQVFYSLLLHAREQMPEGGAIRVRAREEGGKVYVTVSDEGRGLQEAELSLLFDPFSGVGGEAALGLSVAWGVLARLGGSLSATSHHGHGAGTTFALSFPLASPPRPEPVSAVPREQTLHRILIVDDEADNLDVLREVLEIEGQQVAAAKSGPIALALFDAGSRFDLVLCDVGMPEMSGWHVAREIQRLAPGTPVWMLTGWANEISEQDPRRQYVRGVLAKPIDLDQLRALLSEPVLEPEPDEGAAAVH